MRLARLRSRSVLVGALVVAFSMLAVTPTAEAKYRAKKWLVVSWLLTPIFGFISPLIGTVGWGVYNAPELGADIGKGLGKAGSATENAFRRMGNGMRNLVNGAKNERRVEVESVPEPEPMVVRAPQQSGQTVVVQNPKTGQQELAVVPPAH